MELLPPIRERLVSRRRVLAAGTAFAMAPILLIARGAEATSAGSDDVAALHTAAALENLAVRLYDELQALPQAVSGAGNAMLARLFATTRSQHLEHAGAMNTAAKSLGGKGQSSIDQAAFSALVAPALAAITGPRDALMLAVTVEETIVATYARFAGGATHAASLGALCAVAPTEAQHSAVLRTALMLLAAGAPELITLPPETPTLPARAGNAGCIASLFPTTGARPAGEAAVAA